MTKPKRPNQARARKGGVIDWAQQMRFDMEYAKRTLLERGELHAMFSLHTREGVKVYLAPFTDLASKKAMYAVLALNCVVENAEGLTFMSEAWMRRLPVIPGETPSEARRRSNEGPMPAEAEDRVEIVVIETTYRDLATGEKKTMAEMCEITRDWNGKITGLISTNSGADHIEGRVADIFPERPPTEHDREMALQALDIMQKHGVMARPVSGGTA